MTTNQPEGVDDDMPNDLWSAWLACVDAAMAALDAVTRHERQAVRWYAHAADGSPERRRAAQTLAFLSTVRLRIERECSKATDMYLAA